MQWLWHCANGAVSAHQHARLGLKRSSFWHCGSNKCAVYATQRHKACFQLHRGRLLLHPFLHSSTYFVVYFFLGAYSPCYLLLQHKNVATNLRRITMHVCGKPNKLLPQTRNTRTRARRYTANTAIIQQQLIYFIY